MLQVVNLTSGLHVKMVDFLGKTRGWLATGPNGFITDIRTFFDEGGDVMCVEVKNATIRRATHDAYNVCIKGECLIWTVNVPDIDPGK